MTWWRQTPGHLQPWYQLVTPGARASAAMVLTEFVQNIPISVPKGLIERPHRNWFCVPLISQIIVMIACVTFSIMHSGFPTKNLENLGQQVTVLSLTHCPLMAHMAFRIKVNIDSGNGWLPNCIKPLHEPLLTCCHHGPTKITSGHFCGIDPDNNRENVFENYLPEISVILGAIEYQKAEFVLSVQI